MFYSLASPVFLRDNRLSVPPSFNHRHIKELPLPTPHIVPPAGKSFPGAKRSRRQQRQLHRRQRQLFTPIHGGRKAALTVAVFFLLLLPPTSSVSRSSIETALDAPAPLLSGARSLRTGASSAPSGRRVTPQTSSPSAGGQTGEGEGKTETEVVWGVGESPSLSEGDGREGGGKRSFPRPTSVSFHPVVACPSSPISRLEGYSGKRTSPTKYRNFPKPSVNC